MKKHGVVLFMHFVELCIVCLYDTKMMVADATKTCWRIVMYDKTYFIGVNLLIRGISVNLKLFFP